MKSNIFLRRAMAGLLIAMLLTASVIAQTAGSSGVRYIKSIWFESGFALVITLTSPAQNPTGCTRSDKLFVLATNPGYKQIVATVMMAQATNVPIEAWITSCQTFWGNESWPSVYALGNSP